ncbi:efflux RND transporter periplasmic adaptor subunit [Sulfuriferula plumbiphila]|nr:efflux RND transporter periplasmic adaptor subunit [Sulfuriferula plumbiphila]BBP03210.1 RND transporter [Sulfuriferula plumbiphila]
MKAIKSAAVALGLALALAGCSEKDQQQQTTTQAATVTADMAVVQKTVLPIIATAPGSVIAEQQAQIASRLMGFIREMNVQEGQSVVAGQRLFTVDPTDIQGQVSQAKAGLAQAEAALADAKNDYQRFGALYKEEAIPKQQWDKVRLQYQVARQQAAAARAGLGTAAAQMRYATLTAPFAGIITQKLANVGDLATPGRPVLMLENPARLQVQTSVSSDVFAHLKLGDSVSLQVNGTGTAITGTIARLVPAADPVTRTYLVKIDLPQGTRFKSGMYVLVAFPTGQREGVRVPQPAVLDRAGITGVFVVDAQGIAHYRMVRVGDTSAGQVEIQAGLTPGERVVTSATANLQSGDKIVSAGGGNV